MSTRWGGPIAIAVVLFALLAFGAARATAQTLGAIEGLVTTTDGEAPVAHALVFVEGRFQPVETDEHGRFRLDGLPPRFWTLVVQHDGQVEARQAVQVAAGRAMRVAVALAPAPTLAEDVTVTATRYEESTRRVPVSIGSISGEEIRAMRPEHVAQPLNRIPGVHIVAFANEGTHNAIRQPLCCRPTLLMMADGVPLTSPAFYSTSLIRQVNFAQAGRIEVLKGPGTAVHGRRELIERGRGIRKRCARDVVHEDVHRLPLVAEEVVHLGEDEARHIAVRARPMALRDR